MGVRFIIGRAGTGKTRHCFDAIVAAMRAAPLDPAPIYWILPKQATFSAERELTTQSGLTAFCRARVLSFELLGEEVLASCGGAAVPQVTALGRQMLIGHLLRARQEELNFFRGVAQPGLAARLDATFAEFERCGQDPSAVAQVVRELDPSDDAEAEHLRGKLADFHLLYKAYRDALGDERVDPHRRLEQVLDCIDHHADLRGPAVYIDGFLEFTDRERRMIVALAKTCESVEITLLADPDSKSIADVHHLPDDLSLFHRTETQFRLLSLALNEAGVRIDRPVMLRKPMRFESDAMLAVERGLFDGRPETHNQPPRAIKLIETPDRRGEVDAVARGIRAMLHKAELRLRDIAVLVRDIDNYNELISASFREHDIPYFVDRRRSAGHHPLLQLTRAVFQIVRHNWPHEAVLTVIKSGLVSDISRDDADALENYVLLHRLRGGLAWASSEPWMYERKLTRGRDDDDVVIERRIEAARMDALRRKIADALAPFVAAVREPTTIRQIVKSLFELLVTLGRRETLSLWIDEATAENDPERRGEHVQVWEELVDLFDQMVDLLGDQTVDLADFVEILDVGLEQFDLALTPPRVDQVLVGQVERTRTTAVDTVFLLGLSEGQFPRIAREDSVLSDGERRSLRKRKLDIDPESERKLLDENLLGYIAFTRASKRLIVTRAVAQENKPVHPSSFWQRLTRMFPALKPVLEKRESEAAADAIGTPRQLVTAIMRWARRADGAADCEPPMAQLYQFLADHKTYEDPIGVMRYKAWRAVGYRNEAKLSPEVARRLVKLPLLASVTRIETFATCPFKHFARYGLGLEIREDQDVTAMDLGVVYHGILEGIVGRVLKDRKDWCSLEPKVTQQLIKQFAGEIGKTLRGEVMLSTARNQYLLKRIEKTLERVCATQKAVLSRGAFRPAFAELNFGMGEGGLPPLSIRTPRGNEVLLRGKIDRVDLAKDGGHIAVIDYKMRGSRLDLDAVLHGLSLQLLTYLLVLQANGKELFKTKVTPVAAFYAKLLRSLESIKHPDDAMAVDDPLFDLRTKPRGIFDGQYLDHIDADIEPGTQSQVVQARVNKDGTIGNLNASDAAESDAFAALLRFVEQRIGQLADQLIAGVVDVRPYRIGLETPCPHCDFRSVCRFDPGVNQYNHLPAMKRATVLEFVAKPKGAGDGE